MGMISSISEISKSGERMASDVAYALKNLTLEIKSKGFDQLGDIVERLHHMVTHSVSIVTHGYMSVEFGKILLHSPTHMLPTLIAYVAASFYWFYHLVRNATNKNNNEVNKELVKESSKEAEVEGERDINDQIMFENFGYRVHYQQISVNFASKVSTKPIDPAQAKAMEILDEKLKKYEFELSSLAEMEFFDLERIVILLDKYKGDVNSVAEDLLRQKQ